MLFKYVAVFCSVVLVDDGRVVKESVLLFKGPYCRSAFVAVFKYVTVFRLVVLVVDGRVVKESVLFKGPYCASTLWRCSSMLQRFVQLC